MLHLPLQAQAVDQRVPALQAVACLPAAGAVATRAAAAVAAATPAARAVTPRAAGAGA